MTSVFPFYWKDEGSWSKGMATRQLFAAVALHAAIVSGKHPGTEAQMAREAVAQADALEKELQKARPQP